MNLAIILAAHIITGVLCIFYIDSKWKKYATDPFFGINFLRQYNILSRIWPCDDGFLSLKFSAMRHAIIPAVFSTIIVLTESNFLGYVLFFISLTHVIMPLMRNKIRNAEFNESSEHAQPALAGVKSACTAVSVCAIVNQIILAVCKVLYH